MYEDKLPTEAKKLEEFVTNQEKEGDGRDFRNY
jgi:hypothetical protein